MLSSNEIKCVIFDCDGVLVNSEILCCKALLNVFSQYESHLKLDDYIANFKGGKVADILLDTIEHFGIKANLTDVEPLYRNQVETLFNKELKPLDGIEALLDQLSSRDIEFCVISNSRQEKIVNSLQLAGLLEYFNGKIFSAFDVDSWKPEPDLLLYTAMIMGYSPDECVYIDDSNKGIEAGIKAGIKTIHLESNSDDAAISSEHINIIRVKEVSQLNQIIFSG